MSSEQYRTTHLHKAWLSFQQQPQPLDLFLKNYYQNNRSLGSKDRKFLSDLLYKAIRWKGLIDQLAPKECTAEEWLKLARSVNPSSHSHNEELPMHLRLSVPKNFFALLEEQWGTNEAVQLCTTLNQNAPTTARVNELKISRPELLKRLSSHFEVQETPFSPSGFFFSKRLPIQTLPEFREGLFEMQDEGSQLLAMLVDAKPGDHVLDFCAGSGGKTLAFAHRLKGKGQIYLHDIRKGALERAKRRLRRAGIQNAQQLPSGKKLFGKMDWVLVDVPCTGTGTYRRNPDLKWKFTNDFLERLVTLQREIVKNALAYLRPGGSLVYATCSLLKEENEEQVAHFISELPLELQGAPFRTHPLPGGMDGFFGAVMNMSPLDISNGLNKESEV